MDSVDVEPVESSGLQSRDLCKGIVRDGQLQRPLGSITGGDRFECHPVAWHLARGAGPGDGDLSVCHLIVLQLGRGRDLLCEQQGCSQ